jgi:hypothetical protein
MNLFRDKDNNINWDRVSVILGIVISLGGLTYLGNSIENMVEDAVISKLNQPDSKLNYHVNAKAQGIVSKSAKEALNSEASLAAVAAVFKNFRRMDQDELEEYLEETMDFADEMKDALGSADAEEMIENIEWITEQRDRVENLEGTNTGGRLPKTCGDIIVKGGVPALFIGCDGERYDIEYGRPDYMRHATDLCYKYKVYYIETDKGPRVLPSISDIKIEKCR